jgi:hypothetical protein
LKYSAEEDSALRALHAQHQSGRLSDDEFWAAAQSQLPARTPIALRQRLIRVGLRSPPLAGAGAVEEDEGGSGSDENGALVRYWTVEEDRALRALHAQHKAGRLSSGEFWAGAKAQLPTRSQVAVAKRLKRSNLPLPNSEVCKPARPQTGGGYPLWTAAEDSTLAALHTEHKAGRLSRPQFWAAVVSELPSRTHHAVNKRLHRNGRSGVRIEDDGDESDGGGSEEEEDCDEGGAPARLHNARGYALWTAAEDRKLAALQAQHKAGRLSREGFWAAVASEVPSRTKVAVIGRLRKLCLEIPGSDEGGYGTKAFFTKEEDAQLLAEAQSGRHISMAAVAAAVAAKSSRPVTSLLARLKRLKMLGRWHGFDSEEPPQHAADAAAPAPMPLPLPDYADLPPPPLWMLRVPSTRKVVGPYLLSSLRRSVRDGDITSLEARLARAWQVGQTDADAMSLQQALELPKQRSRSRQLERLRRQQQRAVRPGSKH